MDFGYFIRRFDTGCHIDLDREAVIFRDERVTYRDLRTRTYRLANALARLGLKKGERVGVLLRNCTEWFDIFFALAGLGAVLVPVNFLLRPKEVEFILSDSGAAMLLVGEDLLDLVDLTGRFTPGLREIIVIGPNAPPAPARSFTSLTRRAPDTPPPNPGLSQDDLFILQYTSGTTGFPKGAMHTHGTLLWNSFHQIGDFGVTPAERYLCVGGLCWVAGFHDFTLPALWMGGAVVVMPSGGLDMGDLLRVLEVERVTKALLVPTVLKRLVDHPGLSPERFRFMDTVLTGAEPVPVTVIEKFNRLLPDTTLLQGYGLSEGPTIALYLGREDALRKIGSAGKPSTNCELLIVDEAMRRVLPGVKGEIVIRSPATMKGYWNQPEATAATFDGGWLHTGDLAEYDDEGYIYITGRVKDMYISGGLNVYPAEIENVLLKVEGVAEAAVFGVPDEAWGEVGWAVVVAGEGGVVACEALEGLCREMLAGYKMPRRFILRPAPLPRTASGKIKKFELKQETLSAEPEPSSGD